MGSRTFWIVSLTIVVCFFYLFATKPSCRDGFTPVIGGGTGWYCAPGYLPSEMHAPIRSVYRTLAYWHRHRIIRIVVRAL
jgi:hypothetical protein